MIDDEKSMGKDSIFFCFKKRFCFIDFSSELVSLRERKSLNIKLQAILSDFNQECIKVIINSNQTILTLSNNLIT